MHTMGVLASMQRVCVSDEDEDANSTTCGLGIGLERGIPVTPEFGDSLDS